MGWLRRAGLGSVGGLACAGCGSGIGMLGENFPPHDVAFVSYEAPEFPFRLRASSIGEGYAIVVVTVADTGVASDAVVVEASHPAFAEAVLEVIPSWLFRPTPSGTVPRREVVHYLFRRSGVATSMTHREAARAPFEAIEDAQPAVRMLPADVVAPERIDSGATVIEGATAAGEIVAAAGPGVVEVSFVIDEAGNVRVPAVTSASDPSLGPAALAVVRQWRFRPPTHEGAPVLVEVVRSLSFVSEAQ